MAKAKRISALRETAQAKPFHTLSEAADGVKAGANAKFDETIELAFFLGVDPRHAEQMVRGSVSLPHGTGKSVRVIVFCKEDQQQEEAKAAGAMEVGAEDLAKKVADGWTDFDVAVSSPDMMREVGKLGRVLGPRGLMPSPKAGTVTPKVAEAVAEVLKGKIDYRVDKSSNIHVPVGKASFDANQIRENAFSVIQSVVKAKPSACKGTYMKACTISSTMGPGYRMDPVALTAEAKAE